MVSLWHKDGQGGWIGVKRGEGQREIGWKAWQAQTEQDPEGVVRSLGFIFKCEGF